MKKIKLYTILLASVLGFTSCLDKYPEDFIQANDAIKTIDEADQAVIGIYQSFLSPSLYSGDLTLLPEIQSDLAYGVKGNSNVYGDIWRWDIQPVNRNIESVYASLYDVIGRCNFLLQHVDKVRENIYLDKDFDRLDQYCGEAYFARALAYSELIKLFCKAYDSDDFAKNELGVVIRKLYYSDEPIKRASLYDSYQFVIEDLEKAADLLHSEDYNPSTDGKLWDSMYFNEYTVYALRARVALYMKDYESAIKYSSKVIDSGYYKLSDANSMVAKDLNEFQYLWTADTGFEVIWKIGYDKTAFGGSLGRVFFNYNFSTITPDYVPADWVLRLYGNNDLRVPAYFKDYQTSYPHGLRYPLVQKYWGNPEFLQLGMTNMSMPKVFRLAEQYLIRAEAYCQKVNPNYSLASEDLSTLYKARLQKFGGGVSLSESNAMKVIKEERVKELYMEGFRLQDLKRWHEGFERTPQPETLENGNHIKIDKDNVFFVWPIPRHELESQGSQIEPNESNK